ncbi:PaaI family thioesterase [Bordetella sp. N]|uniref:PaaI family thioesterase n=1 Tax=Bordetella sp. N TaxID=1746199 RepID=UPI0007094713|nr:PaaI family thioesterase [Bordetella sp. N]ALM82280.1 thioesterase [Bordetella sp. N]
MGTLTLEQVQERLRASGFNALLNLTVLEADAGQGLLRVRAPFQPAFERGNGSRQWHGGPLAALVDTVGDFALIQQLGRGLPTINFRIDYLRPAVDTDIEVVATVRRAGKSVGVVDVELFDDEARLLALGRATYSTLPPAA